jgi:hypothetical protein
MAMFKMLDINLVVHEGCLRKSFDVDREHATAVIIGPG